MSTRSPSPPNTDDYFEEMEEPVSGGAASNRAAASAKGKRFLLELIQRWYWPALGILLGLLAASYFLSKAPRTYQATSTLLIKQRTASVLNKDQVEEIDMGSTEGMNTVAARIGRLDLLERVASRKDVRDLPNLLPPAVDWTPNWAKEFLGKEKQVDADSGMREAPPAPALAGMIGSWLSISIQRGTRLLDITISHQTPEVAKALADAVAREYLAEIAGSRAEGRTSSMDLLAKEIAESRRALEAAQSAMASYGRVMTFHLLLEEQEKATEILKRTFGPKYPKMMDAEAELASRQSKFLEEFNHTIRTSADREYWEGRVAELEEVKDDEKSYLRLARQLLISRSNVLESEISTQISLFNSMMTRKGEGAVNEQGDESSAEVSSLARVPGGASSPNPNKIYTTGGVSGFAIGALVALIFVRFDNKFHTVAQVEGETGLPVLAAISDLPLRYLHSAEKKGLKKEDDLSPPNPHQEQWDTRLLFRPGLQKTSFAEMYRILRASVSLLGDESKKKVVLFTSALPGEGKTLTSANFALAAAGQGRRTVLVDLDLRKPAVHGVFGLERASHPYGMTELLANQCNLDDAIVTETGAENLDLILSGKKAPNPGELLNVSRIRVLLEDLSRKYDLIVVDTAPMLAVPDTRVLAPLADNLCLVVRGEYVPKRAVERVLELLDATENTPGGIVFNGFKEQRGRIGENYSYGHYRMSRYGNAYQYGYGGYGSYGSYGSDDDDSPRKNKKRKSSRKRVKQKP